MAKQKRSNGYNWQSAQLNRAFYNIHMQRLQTLALNRYKWVNLPETCDERYIEFLLMTNGVASIAFPKAQPHVFYSNQVAQVGHMNIYDNPTRWQAFGNNGFHFDADWSNGVIVYDSRLRMPVFPKLDAYARLLTQFDITLFGNLNAQKVSWLIKGEQTQINAMQNVLKQVLGGEPALIATNGIDAIDVNAISLHVPFIGDELNVAKEHVWGEALQALGITSVSRKAERMIEDEVTQNTEQTKLIALDGLNCRRDAANKLNERFGTDIHVVWAYDNESDVYNLVNNPKIAAGMDVI